MSPSVVDLLSRARARVGTVLRGKYRLERVLGAGGMAVVYEATHRNRRRFAIKVLHAELSVRGDVRARFLREGYAANAVTHPGAVAVLDDDTTEDGAAFLVMELLEGSDLERLWERHGRLSAEHVLAIGYELLDVLAAAHAERIVHRDIKPANLFLTRDGQLKVLDFGIARVRDAADHGAHSTGAGTLLGTPAFMAPEQARGAASAVDERTDVWAVGATLFALFTGRTVYRGGSAAQIRNEAGTTRAPSLASVAPDAPPPLVAIVDPALAFDKSARWPSAAAMRGAVRDAYLATVGRPISRESLLALLGPDAGEAHGAARCADARVGATTAQPISSTRSSSPPGALPAVGLVGAAAACALALVGGAVALSGSARPRADDRSAAVAQPAATRAPALSFVPSTPATSPTAATSAADAAAAAPAPGHAR